FSRGNLGGAGARHVAARGSPAGPLRERASQRIKVAFGENGRRDVLDAYRHDRLSPRLIALSRGSYRLSAAAPSAVAGSRLKASFHSLTRQLETTPFSTKGSPATNSSTASRVVNTDMAPSIGFANGPVIRRVPRA